MGRHYKKELERLEEKTAQLSVLITEEMKNDIEEVLMRKNWNKSAFVRVAIAKELDRILYSKEK
jgi:hypothetical protein